ncbi:hypothetical protein GCM10011391_37240 [Pullulanibacillus camelliae]|uniref:TarS C-terminal domain-containing protein n=1 Tax=Pullulanibacillus camelliae TaxID=1707096 RepID=A0A8J3DZD1_9BACL|nr:CDP-glycerol glycerophosphotransferase family protein [Pullulanibacillus camelliae]GGE54813.1 hypothetical protein GCM10011391_37240 [Pullulanibacillus camelliae]
MVVQYIKKIRNQLLRKSRVKLKQCINVYQNDEDLYISGLLSNTNYKVKELRFVSRFDNQVIKVNSAQQDSTFNFKVPVDIFPEFQNGAEQLYNLFLYVNVPKSIFSEAKGDKLEANAEKVIEDNGEKYLEYPIRLGRFENTKTSEFKLIEKNGLSCTLYITNKGNISFAINHELKPNIKLNLSYLHTKNHNIDFGGIVYSKNSKICAAELSIIGRESNIEIKSPISLEFSKEETQKKYGLNRYTYHVNLDLNDVFRNEQLNEDVYDVYLLIKLNDYEEIKRIRVGKPTFRGKYKTKGISAVRDNEILAVSPYYTIKHFNLSLQVDSFEPSAYFYLRKLMKWYWVFRPFYRQKDIWIIGERPYKAQDTGFHFFKYIREKHPNRRAYYVLKEDSPEIKNVKKYGNILVYKSKKHIKYTLMATKIVGSHHPDYLYPLRTNEFNKKVKAARVFLQHGVIGTKNTVHFYGKGSPSFDTDLFLVSSDYEKEIIVNDFGYDPSEVKVTGLSRFDALLANDVPLKRQLLIIPTWREWLVNENQFLESEYFESYTTLVHHPRLNQLAKSYNFDIVFCLHPNMQQFTNYFKDAPVRVISQGEVDVQLLLKESAMMITDYSSVAFDFSFLTKPIVYYQFDRGRFIGKRGSHLDLDNDLPGDIVYDVDHILDLVEKYAQTDFKMKKDNETRAAKFLKYRDLKSSERIYKEVSNAKRKINYKSLYNNERTRQLYKRFRKSRYYFPTMKRIYNIAKRILPVDNSLIVFESGVGKQYSDSPRYIYEEIVRRNLNYKIVWVCNKKVRFPNKKTKRIKRLSPYYYYYLSRAKIWVNNQNFPTYIIKRPQTTYLQTWHGTPLKKMLFDIEQVQGRSEDYVERVYNATKTWDYLISPSPFATQAFKSAFKYQGNILETGYPRNDIFYKEERHDIALRVKNRLNLPRDKKIIVYAPTFRDNQTSNKNKFLFDINMDLYQMKEQLGEEYIILLRMHVAISNKLKIEEELQDFAFNVSSYSDMQELLLIADILITDYSSVMFDFANTKKPILYYTYDLEIYRDQVRGFYLNFEQEAPGPFMKNTEDIIQNVLNIDSVNKAYHDKYKAFYNKYCLLEDGQASQRIVDKLFM